MTRPGHRAAARAIALAGVAFCAGAGASIGSRSDTALPHLAGAAIAGAVQIQVLGVCAAQACRHEVQLQWVSGTARTVLRSAPLTELPREALVQAIEAEWNGTSPPRFKLRLGPSLEGAFQPYSVVIEALEPGRYRVRQP